MRYRFKKILLLCFLVLVAGFIGSLAYIATLDVPVEQKTISKKIPNERFIDE